MLQTTSSSGPNVWLARMLTFALAGLAVASTTFWVLHWPDTSQPMLSQLASPGTSEVDSDKVARLLGANPAANADDSPAASPSTSYTLLGVIAQGGRAQQGNQGSALIAVEGAGAKAYRVGDAVDDGLVLQAVKARSVTLGRSDQANGEIILELPLLPGMADTP